MDQGDPTPDLSANRQNARVLRGHNRVPGRRPPGLPREVVALRHWNAHSVFFWDPAGNAGEYVARHDLSNDREGEFSAASSEFDPIGDPNGLLLVMKKGRPMAFDQGCSRDVYSTVIDLAQEGVRPLDLGGYPYKIFGL